MSKLDGKECPSHEKKNVASRPERTGHQNLQDRSGGFTEFTCEREKLTDDGTVSQPSDEIVVESVHLAEASAFLAFQVTSSDLNKAVKSLAKDILGERVGSTTKRRKITEFIKTTLAILGKKSFDELHVVDLLGTLWLLKKKVVDLKMKEAETVCLSICEHVENIDLFSIWTDQLPAPSIKDVLSNLREYQSLLKKLNCTEAVCQVAKAIDICELLVFDAERVDELTADDGTKVKKHRQFQVSLETVKLTMFFQVHHFIVQYVFEYCRDSSPALSQRFAELLRSTSLEEEQIGLKFTLDFLQRHLITTQTCQIPEFNFDMTVRTLLKSFASLIKLLRPKGEHHDEILHEILKKRQQVRNHLERKKTSELLVIVPSQLQLERVKSRRLHHWIAPNKERLVGRQRELAQICNLLEERVGSVLISGPSGIGKSSQAREAAFRLRTAWPIQFVLDLSTEFSHALSLRQVMSHCLPPIEYDDEMELVPDAFDAYLKKSKLRLLLVFENLDTLEAGAQSDIFKSYAKLENVAMIFVTRTMANDIAFLHGVKELVKVVIEPSCLSLEETIEAFHKKTQENCEQPSNICAGEMTSASKIEDAQLSNTGSTSFPNNREVTQDQEDETKCGLTDLTKGFPAAVGLAQKLVSNFPARKFEEKLGCLSLDSKHLANLNTLVCRTDNTAAFLRMATIAANVAESLGNVQDMLYTISLLAWPSFPFSLSPEVFGLDTTEDLQNGLRILEQTGLIIIEEDVGGQCRLQMHALVSRFVQGRVLAASLDKYKTILSRCVDKILEHLNVKVEPDPSVRDKITCSALCLRESFFFEGLLREIAASCGKRNLAIRLWVKLSLGLAKYLAGLWHPSSPSFVCSDYAEELLRDSLEGALYLERDCLEGESYLEDSFSSHQSCIAYLCMLDVNCHKGRLQKRQSELLELMIVENILKTEEVELELVVDLCSQCAEAARKSEEHAWSSIYLGLAETAKGTDWWRRSCLKQDQAFIQKQFGMAGEKFQSYVDDLELGNAKCLENVTVEIERVVLAKRKLAIAQIENVGKRKCQVLVDDQLASCIRRWSGGLSESSRIGRKESRRSTERL